MIFRNRFPYIFFIAAMTLAPSVMAQTLSEEVVIDREITPVVRPSVRPSWVLPTVMNPDFESRRLSFYEFMSPSEVTKTIVPLEPAVWADSVMRSPYKGYASLGYFPVYNLGAAAGYRFLQNKTINAGAHLSYDGNSWNGFENDDSKFKQNKFAFGLDGDINFGKGHLLADFNYIYSATAGPQTSFERGAQSINIVDFSVKWNPAATSLFDWDIAADFGYSGFTKKITFDPVKDVTFGLRSAMCFNITETSGVALNVDGHFRSLDNVHILLSDGVNSHFTEILGIISLTPAYKFSNGRLGANLGVRIDLNTGPAFKTRFAPDVRLHWTPSPFLSVYGRATGGEVMNTNRELWERNPWMLGTIAQERSHVNADVEIGLTFGTFKGVWANLHGGWSSVSDWATPVVLESVNTWSPAHIVGFNFGIEAGYSWRWLSLTGHVAGASHRKYYRWQDNAKWDIGIATKLRPIDRLSIDLGYDTRIGRQGFVFDVHSESASYWVETTSLGHTSNLFVGAEYGVTDAISLFVKGENLLNRHWQITTGVRSTGIHGLVGVQYKF